jgi:hypothetical protein
VDDLTHSWGVIMDRANRFQQICWLVAFVASVSQSVTPDPLSVASVKLLQLTSALFRSDSGFQDDEESADGVCDPTELIRSTETHQLAARMRLPQRIGARAFSATISPRNRCALPAHCANAPPHAQIDTLTRLRC